MKWKTSLALSRKKSKNEDIKFISGMEQWSSSCCVFAFFSEWKRTACLKAQTAEKRGPILNRVAGSDSSYGMRNPNFFTFNLQRILSSFNQLETLLKQPSSYMLSHRLVWNTELDDRTCRRRGWCHPLRGVWCSKASSQPSSSMHTSFPHRHFCPPTRPPCYLNGHLLILHV